MGVQTHAWEFKDDKFDMLIPMLASVWPRLGAKNHVKKPLVKMRWNMALHGSKHVWELKDDKFDTLIPILASVWPRVGPTFAKTTISKQNMIKIRRETT